MTKGKQMPHALVQQPNGKLAIWATIVDDFILLDATAPEALEIIQKLHGVDVMNMRRNMIE